MQIISKLKIDKWCINLHCDREKLSQLKVGSLCGVNVKPDHPILIEGKVYPFVVFPTRVTPTFNLEQTSEGMPFDDEQSATEFAQLINGKNQTVPHVLLMSTPGFFGIATATNIDPVRGKLALSKLKDVKIINGQKCGFELMFYNVYVDKPRELVWNEILPTTKLREAKKLFQQKNAERDAKSIADKIISEKAAAAAKAEPALTTSQLHLLSKDYPATVAYLTNPNPANAEAAYTAFQHDMLVLTKGLVGPPENIDFEKIAKAMINAVRRKEPASDEGYYELVAYWYPRRYGEMNPQQRYDDLRKRGYKPHSADAIRKFCERYILPDLRKAIA
jgi:hypothetical protein